MKSEKQITTLVSNTGILQNPTGWHNGVRVWGGGIIKLRKEDWIPWDIDKLLESELQSSPEPMNNAPRTVSARVVSGPGGFIHLRQVVLPDCIPIQGNVHSGAPPPWMIDSETDNSTSTQLLRSTKEKAQLCNGEDSIDSKTRDHANHVHLGTFTTNSEPKAYKPIRSVSTKDSKELVSEDDWLPDFGRVWNEGPRSSTRVEFRKEIVSAKQKMCKNSKGPLFRADGENHNPKIQESPKSSIEKDEVIIHSQSFSQIKDVDVTNLIVSGKARSLSMDVKSKLLEQQKEKLRAKMSRLNQC